MSFCFLWLTCLAILAPAGEQTAQTTKPREGVRFELKKPPSLVFGEGARIDFRFKMQGDYRSFNPDLRREDRLDLRRLRAGVEGELFKVVEYEVEYDFREDDYPLRDAFINVSTSRELQVRAGKFKLPFSREELTGAMNLDFAFRSRAADQLSPGRAIGAMAHGRVLDRRLLYQAGFFREDGENARRNRPTLTDGRDPLIDLGPETGWTQTPTLAARSTITFREAGAFDEIEVGGALTTGNVPEGRHGLRGRMVFGGGFFPALDVNGRRRRLGLETRADAGPLRLQAEFIRVRDERLGQGFDNEDLGPAIATGWYIAGTYLAYGRKPGTGEQPAPAFGGIELAARYEGLRFGGPTEGDEPSRSPRAAVPVPNVLLGWTFGVNWYANRFLRVQGNLIRERLDDATRAPIPGQQIYWGSLLRFQFVM